MPRRRCPGHTAVARSLASPPRSVEVSRSPPGALVQIARHGATLTLSAGCFASCSIQHKYTHVRVILENRKMYCIFSCDHYLLFITI